jgi:YVTN family beta-propeller protein
MSHDGKHVIIPNNGDETISIIDTGSNKVVQRSKPGRHDRRELRCGKAFVHQLNQWVCLCVQYELTETSGRIKLGNNIQLETATTDTADQKLYLAESTTNEVVIIDARTEAVERVGNVGLFPWGTHIRDSKDNYCH